MNETLSKAMENRRSIYGLGRKPPVSRDEILGIIRHAVKFAPTPFNSQSARLLVLFGSAQDRLWELTLNILRERTKPERFAKTKYKIENSFKAGYGTILFFEDQPTVKSLMDRFPTYAEHFPGWSLQASGMLQYAIWTALEAEGLGASLQHYNPLIDERVRAEWNVPESWKLLSQMPFGNPTEEPGEKTFLPLDERIKVYE